MKPIFKYLLIGCLVLICAAGCKSRSAGKSIDGRYYFEDGISESVVTISGDYWTMRTKFGAPGYRRGSDDKFDSGEVKGNTLYHSGFIPYGKVSDGTLTIGFRRYYKK